MLENYYEQNKKTIIEEYFTFLRFKSISSEKEFTNEMVACANWLTEQLKTIGFKVELWETSGPPVIYAENLEAGEEKPTILIYHHYDVQPVDPLEEWTSDPFEPTIRDGEVYARGAQDNKGQCFYTLQALKGLLATKGELPINVKLCIEGEEECGSEGISSILETKKEKLQADYLAIVDAGIDRADEPAVTLGMRGITTMDLEVSGSNTDLHSGGHGGVAFNPIHALVQILSRLRDKEGRITIPGFYDDIVELTEKERASLKLDFDHKEYNDLFAAKATGGETCFTPMERNTLRPTIEINGIYGGYAGSGFKTVIPAKAGAKISCRLVPNQNPDKVAKAVKSFLEKHTPDGVDIKVNLHSGSGRAMRTSSDSPIVKAFAKAYEVAFSKPALFILGGGSIPIVEELAKAADADVVLLGLGLPGDQIHAPNEHFGLDRIKKGTIIIAQALEFLDEV